MNFTSSKRIISKSRKLRVSQITLYNVFIVRTKTRKKYQVKKRNIIERIKKT